MENIVFIVTSFWALGELNIALDFARRLQRAGQNSTFIIPPSHEALVKQNHFHYHLLIPKAAKLNRITFNEVETLYQPQAVILADFLNYSFCESHYGLTMDDLGVFSGKIGAFDLYDFETAAGCVDTYGFQARNMKNLSLRDYDFLLQPCPVNHISPTKTAKVFRYGLFGNITKRTSEQMEKCRYKLGLKKEERMILMTSAVWQHTHRPYQDIQPFINACNRALEQIIGKLPPNYKVYAVGSSNLFTDISSQQFIRIRQLPPERFQELVMATDLFISNNYISTSMVKIALSGIPTLLLQNSYLKREQRECWVNGKKRATPALLRDCLVAYPFRMFPVGWYRFLNHIVRDNPFYSFLAQAELFDIQEVLGKIECLVTEGSAYYGQQRDAYIDNLHKLPDVEYYLLNARKVS